MEQQDEKKGYNTDLSWDNALDGIWNPGWEVDDALVTQTEVSLPESHDNNIRMEKRTNNTKGNNHMEKQATNWKSLDNLHETWPENILQQIKALSRQTILMKSLKSGKFNKKMGTT